MDGREREQAELLWWAMLQACKRRNIAPPNDRVKATILPVIMDGLHQIGGPMGQAAIELAKMLVAEPVEANGILSRIETHIASLRDLLTIYDIDAPSLAQRLNSMDQQAQARHEFMRDALVAIGNDVLAIKARENLAGTAIVRRLDSIDRRLDALERHFNNDRGTDGH